MFPLLVNEGKLDSFTILIFVLFVDALDELFDVGKFLFSHYNTLSRSYFNNWIILP